jgi:hypothetical protein
MGRREVLRRQARPKIHYEAVLPARPGSTFTGRNTSILDLNHRSLTTARDHGRNNAAQSTRDFWIDYFEDQG